MSGLPTDPIRLCEQRDQHCLTERIAGAAARELASPVRLSAGAMARVAMDIEARRSRRHRSHRPSFADMETLGGSPSLPAFRLRRAKPGYAIATWIAAAFLLGVATAASAAHLNLVPSWITNFLWRAPTARVPDKTASRRGAATKSPPRATAVLEIGAQAPIAITPPPAVEPTAASSAIAPALASMEGRAQGPLGMQREARPREPRAGSSKRLAMLGQGRASQRPTVEPSTPQSAFSGRRAEPYLGWSADTVEGQGASVELSQPREPLPPPIRSVSPAVQAAPKPVLPAPMPSTLPSAAQQTTMRLKEIVRALRVDRAPDRALALLDRHASELGGSAFAEESLLLRVEAMLALGQRDAVLRLLDGTSLVDAATSHTLLLIRGELRASVNRCAEGIGDFDLVLTRALRPPRQALLGRARCKERLGDLAGARADLARYRSEPREDALDSAEPRPAAKAEK
jgi:hypothetical protein